MLRKTYMRSKLLNQANLFAGIQSLCTWIISLAFAKSLFKTGFWHNCFFFSKFLLYILRQNLWLNTGKKYFITCKQKIIQENAFSEASFRTLIFFASQILIIISTNKAILTYGCDSRYQVSSKSMYQVGFIWTGHLYYGRLIIVQKVYPFGWAFVCLVFK